jgi:hypothetical protein
MKAEEGFLYRSTVFFFMGIIPGIFSVTDIIFFRGGTPVIDICGKWFLFWGIGIRLFSAGFRQIVQPAFTARQILGISSQKCHLIIRELGFANASIGAAGIISLPFPSWRLPVALIGSLFLGMAGILHALGKPESLNEKTAMVSDLWIFFVLIVYVVYQVVA